MNPLARDLNEAGGARARIAAQLANYYGELADMREPEEAFSLVRLLNASIHGRAQTGREEEVVAAGAMLMGQHPDPNRFWIPLLALGRSMNTTVGGKGGYLVGPDTLDAVDVLRPWSVSASAGATLLTGLTEGLIMPKTTAAVTAVWFSETGIAPSEVPPSLGNVSMTAKTAMAFVKFSKQLLKQGVRVESYLRNQLLSAAGEILDKAYFAGAGGAEPLGLLQTTGIGTQAGAALSHAGVLAMRKQVLTAGGRENAIQWVGTPAVQETLGARERAAGGGRFLWDNDGVLGLAANATKNAPTGALVAGDFSTSTIGVWGPGVRIDIDPTQDFNSAGLVARVILICDVAFPQASAFSVATNVT